MGLAASQGRMLLLTARKSDLEYRAQQISQTRLLLSQSLEDISAEYERKTTNKKLVVDVISKNGMQAQATNVDLRTDLIYGTDANYSAAAGYRLKKGDAVVFKNVNQLLATSSDVANTGVGPYSKQKLDNTIKRVSSENIFPFVHYSGGKLNKEDKHYIYIYPDEEDMGSRELSFEVSSTDDVLSSSQIYRIHSFYECLYEHCKHTDVPYAEIMNALVDETYFPTFIAFSLLERKDKFSKLDDNQKKLYLNISNWCFDTMEKLRKEDIEAIINTFIAARKKDEANNKDSARRYALSSLSETDYPKIFKVVNKMISDNDSIKKYL